MAVFSSWSDSSGLFRERARLCVYVGVSLCGSMERR